ncbi:MAG: type II secretion system protein [Parcubacteria group bacterium]|nr:type II secretion system protein [Parcubacteria group bacterium]
MRGITLLEILIALSIFALLGTFGVTTLSLFKKTIDLGNAADMTIVILEDARSRTRFSEDRSQYGVHFATGTVTLFHGATFIEGALENESTILPQTVEISNITFSGGGSDVLFKVLTGEANKTGTVTLRLKSDVSKTRVVEIQQSGAVSGD